MVRLQEADRPVWAGTGSPAPRPGMLREPFIFPRDGNTSFPATVNQRHIAEPLQAPSGPGPLAPGPTESTRRAWSRPLARASLEKRSGGSNTPLCRLRRLMMRDSRAATRSCSRLRGSDSRNSSSRSSFVTTQQLFLRCFASAAGGVGRSSRSHQDCSTTT